MPCTISEIKTKEYSPSVVLIVVIKLIVDVNWSFHISVHLHQKLKTQNKGNRKCRKECEEQWPNSKEQTRSTISTNFQHVYD